MRAESPDAGRLRLGRASRLAQSRDFARVRQQGERLAQGCLIANWNQLPDGMSPKFGVVTSKKNRRRGRPEPRAAAAPRNLPAAPA